MKRLPLALGLVILGVGVAASAFGQEPEAAVQIIEAGPDQGQPPRFALAERNRLSLSFGYWDAPRERWEHPYVYSGAHNDGLSVGFDYTRFLNERFAVSLGAHVLPIDAGSYVHQGGVGTGARTIVFVPLGLRFNPSGGEIGTRSVKPYLLAGVGPMVGTLAGDVVGRHGVWSGARTEVSIGARVGAGLDFMLGRSWALSLEAGYNWMDDFQQPIGSFDDYSGFELRIGIGWLFGKGRPVAN